MNRHLLLLLVLVPLFSCKSTPVNQTEIKAVIAETTIYQPKDNEILEQILELYAEETETATSELMIKVGRSFLETPYVAHTLETEEEQLVINLRELDCTTYAENCLAITRTIQSGNQTFDQFCSELQEIRYRNGKIDGYPSRLHYFCDWIYTNQQKNLIMETTEEVTQTSFHKQINFMSTHPDSYQQLKKDTSLVEAIALQEREISAREKFYIPETSIAEIEGKLMDGDIAGITCDIDGIAIMHVVILIRMDGRIHIMHASSKAEEVTISENTLEDYLLNSKTATGIMLARPL